MSDKRKWPRFQTNSYLAVHDEKSGRMIGCLVDLTTQGMQIICETQLEPGNQYDLNLDLPESMCRNQKLTVRAENLWVKEGFNEGFYLAGFRFRDLTPEITKCLEEVINSSLFKNREKYELEEIDII